MTMSKKHYQAVAQILHETYHNPFTAHPEHTREIIEYLARRMSQEVFKPDNPNHDTQRFIAAVRGE